MARASVDVQTDINNTQKNISIFRTTISAVFKADAHLLLISEETVDVDRIS